MKPDHEQELNLLKKSFAHIIPKYAEINDIIVAMLDSPLANEVRITDLGCGFGDLSSRILKSLPLSVVFGIDVNEKVLQLTASTLAEYQDRFIPFQRDLNTEAWHADLAPLDAVVSAFSLDFLTHDRHRGLIESAAGLLKPGGRWVSGEFFRSRDPRINQLFHDMEVQYVKNALRMGQVEEEEIDRLAESELFRGPHHICEVEEKIGWLAEAGFEQVDVPWRFLNFAVISGVRRKD